MHRFPFLRHASPWHRLCVALALIVVCVHPAVAARDRFMGEKVVMRTVTVAGGETVDVPVISVGPVPAGTDRVSFTSAGPLVERGKGHIKWSFGLEFDRNASPVEIRIEDLNGAQALTVVDDGSPGSQRQKGKVWQWIGPADQPCTVNADAACARWLLADESAFLVFRATIRYEDGSTDVLHQGVAFDRALIARLRDMVRAP